MIAAVDVDSVSCGLIIWRLAGPWEREGTGGQDSGFG